jgi:hypothetical protein
MLSSEATDRLNNRAIAEQELYETIVAWFQENQYGPSFRDLADRTGRSLGTVHALCRSLRALKKITFSDHISRSIRLA